MVAPLNSTSACCPDYGIVDAVSDRTRMCMAAQDATFHQRACRVLHIRLSSPVFYIIVSINR